MDDHQTYSQNVEDDSDDTIKLQLVPRTADAQNALTYQKINPKLQIQVRRSSLIRKVILKTSKMWKTASKGGGLRGRSTSLRLWPAGDRSGHIGYCVGDISVTLGDVCNILHQKSNALKLEYDWDHNKDAVLAIMGMDGIRPRVPLLQPPSVHNNINSISSGSSKDNMIKNNNSNNNSVIQPTTAMTSTNNSTNFAPANTTNGTSGTTATAAATAATTAATTTAIVLASNKSKFTKKGGRRRLQPQLVSPQLPKQTSPPSMEHRGPAADHKRSFDQVTSSTSSTPESAQADGAFSSSAAASTSLASAGSASKKRRIAPVLVKPL